MFKNIQSLHDYVKKNYEAGRYDATAKEYQQWTNDYETAKAHAAHPEAGSDYQMGYQQALSDHDHGFDFRDYPETMIHFGNVVTGHRMQEVADFIKGYNAAKVELTGHMKD
ncbi:hypothetical protein AWJ15_01940 [Lacticaseibacillus rhamnosus]|uniref:Uncharacterized protein n=1 Tax=Lacticaseibacillus rhamnosus TaxID=47715 RepID=A0AAC9LYJ7_LACRH|nr:hypothetical protein [Lacticaseibacillus rhamnosus]AQG71804.1 hypothetical protein AWJ15_01940 [Lacticaseibacillus rhamnosus]ONN75136.1 hypothetical protein BWR10_05780 [Lacticaseibacillus rhamnosus]QFV09720.1 hypothetical protein GEK51_01980 [Lacticaseibacillus rhamnosus]